MKNIKKIAIFALILTFIPFFCGCTSAKTSLLITAKPSKIIYELNEKFDSSGISVESYNVDGTTTKINVDQKDISQVDTSTAGEKIVEIKKDNLSTTFSIYVASVIVNNVSGLKSALKTSTDGDIIYIKKGEYRPADSMDESLYNMVVDKQLTIVGDGANESIIHGNFLVGASQIASDYVAIDSFENFKLINVGLKLDSSVKNRYLTFEGPYGSYDLFGAIKTFNSNKIFISGCSFNGFSYALNADNISGFTITNCTFRNIKINAIKVANSIKNSVISKNAFMDTGISSLVMENSTQGNVGAINLAFNKAENVGVIIASNTFVRTGLLAGKLVYVSAGADELELDEKLQLTNASYVNNSATIFLLSSAENNLNVSGIIISFNNFGTALKNICFNSTDQNFVNQTGVIINEA